MVVMCLVGYPLLIMEIGIGQKLRHNSITIWTTINPQLGGISIVMCLVTVAMASYYGTIISWGFKYMSDMIMVNNIYLFLTNICTLLKGTLCFKIYNYTNLCQCNKF